jgi:hypothetical protein
METLQTSTKVVQIEDPIQQKREIRPISSTRSLFCKNQANSRFWLMLLIEFHSEKPKIEWSIPYLVNPTSTFDQETRKLTTTHF